MALLDELEEWEKGVRSGMESPFAGPIVYRNRGKEKWQFRVRLDGNTYMHLCKGEATIKGGKFYTWAPEIAD